MKYALTGAMSKTVDEYTIHSMGVPSVEPHLRWRDVSQE